ncbi:hypothetical protein [Peribacillus aracenensis]|uniref:hypothetical protein n=1 Tax=Peribacillus aracenensis TaxID=2976708 RepID=UPI0021A7C84D|nr:hypothetical protein [Peribacillus sp. BBB004]
MVIIKQIQLESKEVEEAISQYLKNEGFKAVSFKFKTKPNMLGNAQVLSYPIMASIEVEDIQDPKTT